MKKFLKKKREVAKVRVEPESNVIPDLKHKPYAMRSTPIAWQTNLFIQIVSCHKTESSTGPTIAPADLLPAEYW